MAFTETYINNTYTILKAAIYTFNELNKLFKTLEL